MDLFLFINQDNFLPLLLKIALLAWFLLNVFIGLIPTSITLVRPLCVSCVPLYYNDAIDLARLKKTSIKWCVFKSGMGCGERHSECKESFFFKLRFFSRKEKTNCNGILCGIGVVGWWSQK